MWKCGANCDITMFLKTKNVSKRLEKAQKCDLTLKTYII